MKIVLLIIDDTVLPLTSGALAGDCEQACLQLLPAATLTTMSKSTSFLTTSFSTWENDPPSDIEQTAGFIAFAATHSIADK